MTGTRVPKGQRQMKHKRGRTWGMWGTKERRERHTWGTAAYRAWGMWGIRTCKVQGTWRMRGYKARQRLGHVI